MTGKEKIEAALSPEGTPEIPVAICYTGIYVRDCWPQLTSCPWWYARSPCLKHQLSWRRDVIRALGQDWFDLSPGPSRQERERIAIEERPDGIYRVDRETGEAERLRRPSVAGQDHFADAMKRTAPNPQTPEEIDRLLPLPPGFEPSESLRDGRGDLPRMLLEEFPDLFPVGYVTSPLWSCSGLWGLEGFLTQVLDRPELVEHACQRHLELAKRSVRRQAAIGTRGIFVEECFTDLISPADYRRLCLPCLRELLDEIRSSGMRSIHYYCGNPAGKWDLLLDAGADAISLEEGKKNFEIDIEAVVEKARGRCAVVGNLDSAGILARGSEEKLREEIRRQIAAGRRNRGRFIMGLGSPVTPDTPLPRVRRFCELARELGRS